MTKLSTTNQVMETWQNFERFLEELTTRNFMDLKNPEDLAPVPPAGSDDIKESPGTTSVVKAIGPAMTKSTGDASSIMVQDLIADGVNGTKYSIMEPSFGPNHTIAVPRLIESNNPSPSLIRIGFEPGWIRFDSNSLLP
ncbi:hypothetical protein BGX28_008432, partial [Mortierella sp. GBA30]